MIGRLALADLRHEWVLTNCIILALASVIAPLLLILGLKLGTIETLRSRLLQDPSNLEIRPLTSSQRPLEWFAHVARWPGVAFVIPTTRQIAATVNLRKTLGAKGIDVDLVPTAEGDRLLSSNGTQIPRAGQLVLSALAAESLSAQAGDAIHVGITRSRGSDSEEAIVQMEVVAVLSARVTGLRAAYAPLPFLEAVEAYKDGLAVPELGTGGDRPVAQPVYDGAIIILPRPLPEQKRLRLVINTGFSDMRAMTGAELVEVTGWNFKAGGNIYLLKAAGNTVGQENFIALNNLLRGEDPHVLPWVRPLDVIIRSGISSPALNLRVHGLSLPESGRMIPGLSPAPPWGGDPNGVLAIVLPKGSPPATHAMLTLAQSDPPLTIPVNVLQSATENVEEGIIPARLAGILRLASERKLRFDEKSGAILLERKGYSSFRLYARTLDDVKTIRKTFAKEGVNVHTESQRIDEVATLDRQLSRVFWLISAVGTGGGVAALVASLYASVERKRQVFGILRLVGVARNQLVRFPVYQGMLFGLGGYVAALIVFHLFAITINHLFASSLGPTEKFCRLPWPYQLATILTVLFLAALAASLAAIRVNRTSPADALRAE